MKVLQYYIIKNHTKILLLTLTVGICLYLLTDLFERLENFIAANVSIKEILIYFFVKTPLIISQILPVIFLISTIIQLCLMTKNKELIALQSSGISPSNITKLLFICALFWGTTQILFSEYLGVLGNRESLKIWQESVRKKNLSKITIYNIWFTEDDWVISIDELKANNTGKGFTAYLLDEKGLNILKIIWAMSFSIQEHEWNLYDVSISIPNLYTKESFSTLTLPFKQSTEALRIIHTKDSPRQLPIWELFKTIKELELSGSNVEVLKTNLYARPAYAFSLIIMVILATTITTWKNNIYLAIPIGLIYTFIYYSVYILGISLAEKGILPPMLGAWMANGIFLLIAIWKKFLLNSNIKDYFTLQTFKK